MGDYRLVGRDDFSLTRSSRAKSSDVLRAQRVSTALDTNGDNSIQSHHTLIITPLALGEIEADAHPRADKRLITNAGWADAELPRRPPHRLRNP